MKIASPPSPPRMRLRDGRTLAYAVYGKPSGRPLYAFHGFPGSRLQVSFLHARAQAAGVCIVAPDRPGFGRSTHDPRRTLRSWADDVEQLADHLNHRCIDLLGVSCGGAYALACAHDLPHRVGQVVLMGGMGPMDLPSIRREQLPVLAMMFALARLHPALVAPMLSLDRLMFRRDPQRAVRTLSRMLSGPDQALLASEPHVAEGFGASLAEAYRHGIRGAMREAQLIASDRGFLLEDIRAPVLVIQGGRDRHVPPAIGQHLADRLPSGRLRFFPNEGHLSVLWNCFDEGLAALARHKETAPCAA